ncbi:hypothetical protein BKA64DRAFT_595431 [Cadophora sp. MPI-SDFR-AT-0126]|nr:hypothetical protein BKA64DRAFT_595431 [Leotiomycetes sp. MPI-SDFR-AT-0126]
MDSIKNAPVRSTPRTPTPEEGPRAIAPPEAEDYFGSYNQQWEPDEKDHVQQPVPYISNDGPTVDLSSFAGPMDLGTKYGRWEPDEYLPPNRSLPRPRTTNSAANWKPVTMRWPYLSIMVFISVALAGLQEFVFQHSRKHGGLLAFETVNSISTGQYFLWRYAPTLALVLFGLMVEATDFEMKKLQPYYSMARPEGASAAESVLLEPLSPWTYLTNPRLVGIRVFTSEIMVLNATLAIPTLQNASLGSSQDEDFKQHVVVNNVWSRLLTVSLLLLALSILGVLILNARDKSGLFATPRGIVGVAKMATRSHVLMLARNLDLASPSNVRTELSKARYFLKNGFLDLEYITSTPTNAKGQKGRVQAHPSMLNWKALLAFICFLATVLVVLGVVLFTKANSILQKIPLLTSLGVVVKILWSMIDDSVRLMEPLYILAMRHARPGVLFLDYTGTSTLAIPFQTLRNRHFLLFTISLNSILVEVLTVCLSSFKAKASNFRHRNGIASLQSDEETFTSFWASLGLSLGILTTLACTAGLVFWKRRRPFCTQLPGTIATSMILMHQSRFLSDMDGTERMTVAELQKKMEMIHKRYGLGWFQGRDGQTHAGIDEEELLASYTVGVDRQGQARVQRPWETSWETY